MTYIVLKAPLNSNQPTNLKNQLSPSVCLTQFTQECDEI